MSCWHGWHGCGPWYGPPCGRDWYGPADWEEERERPIRRRYGRYARLGRPEAPEDLEARLADLREELSRVESALSDLRRHEETAADGP